MADWQQILQAQRERRWAEAEAATVRYELWTEEEKAIIMARESHDRTIAEQTGRSFEAIVRKRYKLKTEGLVDGAAPKYAKPVSRQVEPMRDVTPPPSSGPRIQVFQYID